MIKNMFDNVYIGSIFSQSIFKIITYQVFLLKETL